MVISQAVKSLVLFRQMNKAIEVDHISVNYGSREVLKDISFDVIKGTIHGFLGPNGAGKTTTMRLITKLMSPKSGSIKIFVQDTNKADPLFHQKVGFLLENPPLYGDLKVKEYLYFVAQLKKIPREKISSRIDYCVEVLDLGEVTNRLLGNLSKGFKQRVGIAQAIINMPEIVILDEPTVGLDPQAVIEMRNLILKLKKEHTILLSSHLLHEMSLVCDEVTIISNGKIMDSGKIEDLRNRISKFKEIHIDLKSGGNELAQFLENSELIRKFTREQLNGHESFFINPATDEEIRPMLIEKAVSLGAEVMKLDLKQKTLEDIFISITEAHD